MIGILWHVNIFELFNAKYSYIYDLEENTLLVTLILNTAELICLSRSEFIRSARIFGRSWKICGDLLSLRILRNSTNCNWYV